MVVKKRKVALLPKPQVDTIEENEEIRVELTTLYII